MSHCWGIACVFFVFLIRHPVSAPASHRLLQVWALMRLSAATNSCRHFSPSPTNRPDCFVSCHVMPVIVYFPRRNRQQNDCLYECPSPKYRLSPPPPSFPTSPLSSPLNPDCSFHRLSRAVPVCLCLWPQAVSACSQRLNLHVCVHTEWMLCVCLRAESLEAIFVALPPCCVCRTLKLSLGNEKWSLNWLLYLPPPRSVLYAPHKMQLARELIPPPAEL